MNGSIPMTNKPMHEIAKKTFSLIKESIGKYYFCVTTVGCKRWYENTSYQYKDGRKDEKVIRPFCTNTVIAQNLASECDKFDVGWR